ncbi:MAG: restriction endonuclease subunit S [Comamonas sp.]|nr:restriction endonuclease subunit S [Comamonas sp.]
MNEWQILTLADVCTVITDGAHQSPKTVARGKPMASVKDLTRFGVDLTSARHIATEDFEALVRQGCKPHVGDVLIAKDGNSALDTVCTVDHPLDVVLLSSVAILRPDPKCLDSFFLKFYLSSPETIDYLKSNFISGAAIPRVVLRDFKRAEIRLPSLDVQRRIARVLQSIDSKIDLNRRINQTLEAMAQAIFQSWFVDFEPVKAKIAAIAEGRDPLRAAMGTISGKPEAELDALPPEQYDQLAATAALFPDEMEESELGEIPKGWFVRTMPDCIDVNPSRTLKKGSVAHYLDMANVPTNSARVQNIVSREFTSGSKFKNGDTLLARITPCLENGKTAFVDFLNGDEVGWGSTEFIVLRPKNGLPEPFAYFLCRYPDFRAFAISQMAGTSGRQRVPNDCFGGYKLVEPPAQVAVEFGRHAGVALSQMKALDEEARALASLRETLLPKLLSGELPVAAIAPTLEATP